MAGDVWAVPAPLPAAASRYALTVRVTFHAQQRALVRHQLAGYADALQALRYAARGTTGYAWTAGYERVYVLDLDPTTVYVITVLPRDRGMREIAATDTAVGCALRAAAARARLAP